jgi:hypothetical protein
MKRRDQQIPDERAEEELAAEIRRLTLGDKAPPSPSPSYWPRLLVRTNQRIDEATSPKALTLSWAARVAIPGVVAILSFFIGLRYFMPVQTQDATPLEAVVMAMPDRAVDTLLSDPSTLGTSLSAADLGVDPFDMPKEQLAEYLISSANVRTVTEAFSDDQVTEVLTILGSRSPDLFPGAR